ncbi:unnamed protein product [Aphis gossypii]|uniref:Uncharacterized protein n=1 Tax=Aphis gossypii TaxID=80765 RepID=A0A9P0NIT0_APHGO|nr:unnamed protein product [Aphis gossypii]
MDPTSSNDVEYDLYHQDVSPVLSTDEASTFDIESPGTVKTNVEVAVPVVYPGEEPTLKPAHSTELMTEAISFVEPDPNAPVDTPTCEVEMPGLESDNIEVAKSAVCPAEEETLSLAHVEADTNALVETSTCVIEIFGPNMENVAVAATPAVAAPSAVVSLTEVQALSSGEKRSDKQTSNIDKDVLVPLEKKKSRFLSALRRGLRRVFKTICCCGCSAASSGEEDYRDEFTHEIEAFNERLSV